MSVLSQEALRQHIAILGKTGSGKTYTAKGIVEGLLAENRRVGIVDPTGAWWGLQSSADGKKAGFDVIVMGGQHGNVSLPPLSGAACAQILTANSVQIVFDTSAMTVGERTRWFTDFASALFRLCKSPTHLVIDEAHMFAPQSGGGGMDPQTGQMLHAANTLASGGRSRGVRLMLITQRPAKLHKDSLTCCDTLIAMRVIAPQDRTAIEDWVKGCGDKKQGQQVLDSLAQLAKGEGWIWFPEGGVLERRRFPKITTFDSSKTPEDGEEVEVPKTLAQIDLTAINAAMEQAVQEAKENDPKALREEIKVLRRKLDDATKAPQIAAPLNVDRLVEERTKAIAAAAEITRIAAMQELAAMRNSIDGIAHVHSKAVEILQQGGVRVDQLAAQLEGTDVRYIGTSKSAATAPQRTTPRLQPAMSGKRSPHEKILDAIAWWKVAGVDRPTRVQVGCVAGYTASGGTFSRYVSALSSEGLITYPDAGTIDLTTTGQAKAEAPATAPTLEELHARVFEILEAPHRKILAVLIQAKGKELGRTNVGELSGYESSGGTFNRYVSHLSSLGLIRYPRKTTIAAAEILFPEGLE